MIEKTWKVAGDAENGFIVDDAFIHAVEKRVGVRSGGWCTLNDKDLCSAIISEFMNRYERKEH